MRALGLCLNVSRVHFWASSWIAGNRPSSAPQRFPSTRYFSSSHPWSWWAPSLVSRMVLDCTSGEEYLILGLTVKPQSMPASLHFLAGTAGPPATTYIPERPVRKACSLFVVPTSTPGLAMAAPSLVTTSAQRSMVCSNSPSVLVILFQSSETHLASLRTSRDETGSP